MEQFPGPPLEQEPVDQNSHEEAQRRQVLRLVRLGKNFRKAIRGLPNEQRYIDEHKAVTRTIIRDPSEIEGRY